MAKPVLPIYDIVPCAKPSGPADVLRRAFDVLRRRGRWVQGNMYRRRSADGLETEEYADKKSATCACSVGVLNIVAERLAVTSSGREQVLGFLNKASASTLFASARGRAPRKGEGAIDVNDHALSFKPVGRMWERAIAEAHRHEARQRARHRSVWTNG